MKKLVSLILALAVALSLTGAAFAEEPVTITYATFSASGAQEETLKKMVEVFEEKNPDIKVDVQLTGYDDYFTKLATTGGFLMAGNVTILVGVDEEKVQAVIDIIKEHSHSRKQMIPTTTEMSYGYYPSMPVEVTVGGATIFVVDIERFERA